jgi:hypothetical protein
VALAGLAALALNGCSKQPADDSGKPGEGGETAAARAKRMNESQGNLKRMVLAVHAFHDDFKSLPPAAICDKKTGKPLLSWRVALLPYLKQEPLFKEFKLDEAWDGPHNKKLLDKMPSVYAPVGVTPKEPHATFYRVFVAPPGGRITTAWAAVPLAHTPFGAQGAGPIVRAVPDGTSNTFGIVEAGEAVPWTKPEELEYDAKKPLPKLGGLFNDGFNAALLDGAVIFVTNRLDEPSLRAFITANGDEMPELTNVDSLREKNQVE